MQDFCRISQKGSPFVLDWVDNSEDWDSKRAWACIRNCNRAWGIHNWGIRNCIRAWGIRKSMLEVSDSLWNDDDEFWFQFR